MYGVRPQRIFREAATRYLNSNLNKRSIDRDAQDLRLVEPFIGDLKLHQIHMGTLEPFIQARRKDGKAAGTINRTLAIVRRVLNLSSGLWRDENGLSWLEAPPMIQLVDDDGKRKPYPMSWPEQDLLFSKLPSHLKDMALYKVNSGSREQEVCQLHWEWEIPIPELGTSVFLIPEWLAKNGVARVIVLNRMAREMIERQRGKHPTHVFTFRGKPVGRMYNSSWRRQRDKAAKAYSSILGRACPEGFKRLRVHDLKHTFGKRLRAADVSFEDRQDLLGHKSSRITTDYSAAEIGKLIEAAEKACDDNSRKAYAINLAALQRPLKLLQKQDVVVAA